MKAYDLIIFDLDGTLLDTSRGIFNSVRFSEQKMGLIPMPEERLKEFVGPPPQKMYASIYNLDEAQAFQATFYHRQYGKEHGIYEATIYPGIKELLNTLKTQGVKLAVATLKLENIAEKVLLHYGLYDLFDVIVGMDVDESLTKAKTIELVLKKMGVVNEKALMVGDSSYDEMGARQIGVDFVAALYGFGFSNETTLTAINYPLELLNIL